MSQSQTQEFDHSTYVEENAVLVQQFGTQAVGLQHYPGHINPGTFPSFFFYPSISLTPFII